MTSITALNVRLGMDASNFTKGADLARSEVNRVASIMRQSVPPAEKYQQEIDLLNKTFSAAGRQSKQYHDAVEHLRKKHGQAEDSAKKLRAQITAMPGPLGNAASRAEGMAAQLGAIGAMSGPGVALAGVAAGAIAIGGAATAVVKFNNEMTRARATIDEQAKSAAKLGMSYRELQGINFAGAEIAGTSAAQIEAAIKQLQIRAAKAVQGDKTIQKAFESIGLDAGKAMEGGPLAAIQRIAKGMENTASHAEKLNLMTQLFGKSGADVVALLTAGSDALEESVRFSEKWKGLTDGQVLGVEAANDAMGRLHTAAEGFTNQLAAATAPLVESMANNLLAAADSFGRMDSVANGIAESFAMKSGDTKDYFELFSLLSDLPKKTWKLDFGGAADVIKDAFTFDAGPKQYMELLQRRGELEFDAAEKARKRESERGAMSDDAIAGAQALAEEFDKQLQAVERQIIAMNKGEAAVRQIELAAQGFSEEQIKQIEAQHTLLDSLKAEHERRKKIADEAKRTTDEQERQAKITEDAFNRDIGSALSNAQKYFEDQRKRDDARRKAISQGPETLEVGSAGAAKFMADRVNAAIGAAAVPERPTPGERELIAQFSKQFAELQKANESDRQLIRLAREQVEAIREHAVRRAR